MTSYYARLGMGVAFLVVTIIGLVMILHGDDTEGHHTFTVWCSLWTGVTCFLVGGLLVYSWVETSEKDEWPKWPFLHNDVPYLPSPSAPRSTYVPPTPYAPTSYVPSAPTYTSTSSDVADYNPDIAY